MREHVIYSVDFDGTLCKNNWPDIGEPNVDLIAYLKNRRENGDKVILFTMREGKYLEDALAWCAKMGLEFDTVNDNLPEMYMAFGNNPRKVFADCYIDDRNFVSFPGADFIRNNGDAS